MKDEDNKKPEKFSDDPEEQLRIENELLKLKFNAETGGEFENLQENPDPVLENAFIKSAIEFEKHYAQSKTTTVYEMIGKPDFEKSDRLNDEQLSAALERINHILGEHQIAIDYGTDYPPREKYRFITEEIFMQEIDDMHVPGMMQRFFYEEFHPSHEYDIWNKTIAFMTAWFEQNFSESSPALAEVCITNKGKAVAKNEMLQKAQNLFDSYERFENERLNILEVRADIAEDKISMGFAEGVVKYDAVTENGETVHFKGPFKIYFQLTDNWWEIFFFYWPGFEW